jgi:hypothetical protein
MVMTLLPWIKISCISFSHWLYLQHGHHRGWFSSFFRMDFHEVSVGILRWMVPGFSPISVFSALASVSPLCEGMVTQALKFLAE